MDNRKLFWCWRSLYVVLLLSVAFSAHGSTSVKRDTAKVSIQLEQWKKKIESLQVDLEQYKQRLIQSQQDLEMLQTKLEGLRQELVMSQEDLTQSSQLSESLSTSLTSLRDSLKRAHRQTIFISLASGAVGIGIGALLLALIS